MTINESFFDQYSVFCVFGSVVGCVVVPLIAQVLQQQSMECMILSAIVLSLTAAHLKKKSIGENHNHLKIAPSRDYEKKRVSHNNNKKNHKQYNHHASYVYETSHVQDFIQQNEYLKIIENEKRSEERKLKKQRKREERLKRKEEENKKEKELEERYRLLRVKRQQTQHHKEHIPKQYKTYLDSSIDSFDAACNDGKLSKSHYTRYHQFARIPRLERPRADCYKPSSLKSLSVSCSSLSSISSSDSSTNSPSPPPPVSNLPPCASKPAWSIPSRTPTVVDAKTLPVKSYQNIRSVKTLDGSPVKSLGFSTSLFCSQPDEKPTTPDRKQEFGQYSLFGSCQFGSPLMK